MQGQWAALLNGSVRHHVNRASYSIGPGLTIDPGCSRSKADARRLVLEDDYNRHHRSCDKFFEDLPPCRYCVAILKEQIVRLTDIVDDAERTRPLSTVASKLQPDATNEVDPRPEG